MTITQEGYTTDEVDFIQHLLAVFGESGGTVDLLKDHKLVVREYRRHIEAAEACAREDIEAKLRNVISHATGGSLDDTTLPLNEIAVRISAFRTRLWNDALAKGREEGAKAMQSAAARIADKRAEERFAEHGTTEPDTNASYYSGRRAEALDELDEEDWAIRDAIATLDPAQIAGGKP